MDVLEHAYRLTKLKNIGLDYSCWIDEVENNSKVHFENNNALELQLFSFILIDQSDAASGDLKDTTNSVLKQSSSNWELIISSRNSCIDDNFLKDQRIQLHTSESDSSYFELINSALEECQGQYVSFLSVGDQLSEHAVSFLSAQFLQNPLSKLIVTDEDQIDDVGARINPYFKPDWNPDYLNSFNYFSKAVVYEKLFIKELGGFNTNVNDPYYDLALRATERLADVQIHHISKVLFHFKQCNESRGEVFRVKYDIPQPMPLVSIIIPTKDQLALLINCIDGVINKTCYKNIEVIIVDNQSERSETLHYFNELINIHKNIRILHYDKPFNYSDMNNIAVSEAKGDIIVFLNNDVSVIGENTTTKNANHDDWLTEMVSQACRAEIGCVGAKLFYPDDTIQHGGVILGLKGCASHAHKGFEGDSTGYFNRLIAVHNVSAVTAACMAVRKEVFEKVGGFDAVNLKVAYNDVDLCLKVREAGYRNLFTPNAQLIHHESKSRGKKHKRNRKDAKKLRKEAEYLKKKWRDQLFSDPAYNKNLTLLTEDFSLGLGRKDQ